MVSDERGANKRRPVGLLFAGSDLVTVANPYERIGDAKVLLTVSIRPIFPI